MNNLEVSTDESDSEDDINFHSEELFIQPPVNANDKYSEIDSGDENQATGDVSTLNGKQPLGSAVLQINAPSS